MDKVNGRFADMPLRRAFILCVLITAAIVAGLSAITIIGCTAFRGWLMPESDEVFLTISEKGEQGESLSRIRLTLGETQSNALLVGVDDNGQPVQQDNLLTTYSVEKIENSYSGLTPRRKLAYTAAGAAMVTLPVCLAIAGLLLCAFWFYKHKLSRPIDALAAATESIAAHDLDFTVEQCGNDELGRLCGSFERMRAALHDANRELWAMLEERKLLQASIAHDLRNPIAVIDGYAEYMQMNLPSGQLDSDQLLGVAGSLSAAAGRLRRYTDSIRDVNSLEELSVSKQTVELSGIIDEITGEMRILAEQKGISLSVEADGVGQTALLDASFFGRVAENVFQNALRFARSHIDISFTLHDGTLVMTVADDGCGFSEKRLSGRGRFTLSGGDADGHMGMGLMICGILCRKHGGKLDIANRPEGGAVVSANFRVRE